MRVFLCPEKERNENGVGCGHANCWSEKYKYIRNWQLSIIYASEVIAALTNCLYGQGASEYWTLCSDIEW